MHGDVGVAGLHRDLEFLDEQAFAADLLQAFVENFVTPRGQRDELDGVDFGQRPQKVGNMVGLPECKRALARCNANIQSELPSFQAASNVGQVSSADY